MTVTDYPDWGVTQDQANKISTTGVPLLHNKLSVTNQSTTLLVNGTQSYGPFTVGSICQETWISAEATAGTPDYLDVELDWTDSTSGLLLDTKQYRIIAGALGSPHTAKIYGPVHGDQVKVTLLNPGASVSSVNAIVQLIATSRLYTRDGIRSIKPHAGGFTLSGAFPQYGILLNASPNVGAGLSTTVAMAAYMGRVFLEAHTNSGTNNMTVELQDASGNVIPNNTDVYRDKSNANGDLDAFLELPSFQLVAVLTNGGAAAQALNITIQAEESAN